MHCHFRWLRHCREACAGKPTKTDLEVKATTPEEPISAGDQTISGPYTQDNLTIFLIHGEDRLKGRKYMLLAEALEKKEFVIYETQNVNELSMENLSPSDEVLILSATSSRVDSRTVWPSTISLCRRNRARSP